MRATLGLLVLSGIGALSTMLIAARSPFMTGQDRIVEQPIPFSHQHHVGDAGIDCRYCHQAVEDSPRAGVPSTQICMTCHRKLWDQSEMLAPVRNSWQTNRSLHWHRVHDLPDYVFFNHSIHIHKGIGCYSCHGDLSAMPLTRQASPLTMQWCLDCHKNPSSQVRPRSLVYATKPLNSLTHTAEFRNAYAEVTGQLPETRLSPRELSHFQNQLAQRYQLKSLTDCYTCHR
ncbi:cytochrome c3 family protein [Gimesia chilikensis]|uniref:cytochrome c3 family protein n=1 Tax=Gimesia chilikensis TaxID=2605989 RepID=UPI0018E0A93B|nr:cytochrome c3 family protein [Gimesia chilikensis]